MKEIDRIVAMLRGGALEKRIAAAIVLGEIEAKGAEVVAGLGGVLGSGIAALERAALEALAKVGAKKALPQVFPLLTASTQEVRDAAIKAVASVGEEVVPLVKERMATAEPELRRALDAVLADVGGKDAFSTLIRGLASADGEAARAAALAVRQQVKLADGNKRRSYLAETERFLEQQKKKAGPAEATAAALKILGFLEDERALDTLLAYASDAALPPKVRLEAIIALRFCLGDAHLPAAGARALVSAAHAEDRTVAQAALHTLGSLKLGKDAASMLEPLALHVDADRAIFAVEHLGRQPGPEATRVLVKALTTRDKRVAEVAQKALAGREDAVPSLARALLETQSSDRAWSIRAVLRPQAKKLTPALKKELLADVVARIEEHERGWEAHLDVVREADPDGLAEALHQLVAKAKRAKNLDKALGVLYLVCKSERASDEDRFALASLELAKSPLDTAPASRYGDEALRRLGVLLDRGFDVGKALLRDKTLELEQLYYVGFHFAEAKNPLGDELLAAVVERGGRAKVAKMAKNKLALAGGASRASTETSPPPRGRSSDAPPALSQAPAKAAKVATPSSKPAAKAAKAAPPKKAPPTKKPAPKKKGR